jgi:hypothetical protein
MTGKRKRDDISEPAQVLQQTKRPKARHLDKQLDKQVRADIAQVDIDLRVEHRELRNNEPMTDLEDMDELLDIREGMHDKPTRKADQDVEQADRTDRLQGFMNDIGMHPQNPDASTMAVRLPKQGGTEIRILTASTVAKTGRIILHDTSISQDRDQTMAQQAHTARQPYLKVGVHGRHGDFENDLDRQTGRGHELSSEDQIGLGEYMDFRARKAGAEQEMVPDIKDAWNENEQWYTAFTRRYPGFSVSHLWPCGCEKWRGESEDSDSEEE